MTRQGPEIIVVIVEPSLVPTGEKAGNYHDDQANDGLLRNGQI